MLQTQREAKSPCLDAMGKTLERVAGQQSSNPACSAFCVALARVLNLSESVSSLVWEVVARTK